MVLKWSLHHN